MGRLDTTGIEGIIADLTKRGQLTGEVAKAMLLAGAVEMKTAWEETIKEYDYIETGDMLASIGTKNGVVDYGEVMEIDIYPQGKDRTGTRNAEKAFLLHYGHSNDRGSADGSHWVDDVEESGQEPAIQAMTRTYEEFNETGRVPEIPDAAALVVKNKRRR